MIRGACDLAFWLLLAEIVFRDPFIPWPARLLASAALLLAWLPRKPPPPETGHLPRAYAWLLLALFLFQVPYALETDASRWPLGFSGLLFGLGVLQVWANENHDRQWSKSRVDWTLAAVVMLGLCVLIAGANHAILTYLADDKMLPGRIDFLIPLVAWAGVWFGLDVQFRGQDTTARRDWAGWLWARRHLLGVTGTAIWMAFR